MSASATTSGSATAAAAAGVGSPRQGLGSSSSSSAAAAPQQHPQRLILSGEKRWLSEDALRVLVLRDLLQDDADFVSYIMEGSTSSKNPTSQALTSSSTRTPPPATSSTTTATLTATTTLTTTTTSSSGGTNATAPNLVPNLQRKREVFFRNVKDLLSSALEQIGGSLHAADAAAAEDPLAPRTIVKNAVGLLGFVRFLRGYYLVLVTKKKTVGVLGNHKIFEVEKVELLPLFAAESDDTEEQRWAERWLLVLRNGNFYFAHSYELSRTVQQNMADKALALVPRRREDSSDVVAAADDVRAAAAAAAARDPFYSDPEFFRFVWNEHLLRAPMLEMTVVQRGGGRPTSTSSTTRAASLASNPLWRPFCLTIIHGVFARTTVSSYSQQLEVALLSRRSARFAGTRFRKRGLNARGHCGNDVETEQIVYRERPNSVLAFVQMRASAPLFWSQELCDGNNFPLSPLFFNLWERGAPRSQRRARLQLKHLDRTRLGDTFHKPVWLH